MYGCPQTSYPHGTVEHDADELHQLRLWAKATVETQTGACAPFSGHSRCRDRRVAQDMEYAQLDGPYDETDSLHQRRAMVRAIPQSSSRGGFVSISGRYGRRCRNASDPCSPTLPRPASPVSAASAGSSIGRAWSRPVVFALYAVCASYAAFGPVGPAPTRLTTRDSGTPTPLHLCRLRRRRHRMDATCIVRRWEGVCLCSVTAPVCLVLAVAQGSLHPAEATNWTRFGTKCISAGTATTSGHNRFPRPTATMRWRHLPS